MAKEKINGETVVSTAELASVLDLTARRIQQLVQEGTITAEGRGKYKLGTCVKEYLAYQLRAAQTDAGETAKERDKTDLSLKKAKATIATLQAQELVGKMHRSEDVMKMTGELLATVRGSVLAMPGRCAMEAAAAETAAEAAAVIRNECIKVLDEISEFRYDPAKYEELVRERQKWSKTNDSGGD